VLFAASVLGALIGIGALWLHLTQDPLADVRAYYEAAQRLNAGAPLYPPAADTNVAEFYRYPPLLAVLLRPLAALPYPVFAAVWELGIIAALVATLWLVGIRARTTWLVVGMLAMPIAWATTIGQAQVLVTFLLTLGTPLGVALAGQLKLFPALVALYWLGRRDWPSLGRFIAWSVGLVALQLLLEPRGSIDFLGVTNLQQVGEVRNFSPYAISPALWVAFVVVGAIATLALARTRWGWAAAVSFSIVATPRFLLYMLMSLLAALRPPVTEGSAIEARDEVGDRALDRNLRIPAGQ
jgi:hypothetical protein